MEKLTLILHLNILSSFLLITIKKAYPFPQPPQMQIDKNIESTDPITGFTNPFRRTKLDTDAIVIQRRNFKATTYHLLDDSNGHPIFTRPLQDKGKRFIFFNNPSFPQGSGHYIVLRKMEGQDKKQGFNPAPINMRSVGNPINGMPQFMYETFTLSFKDTLAGSVTDLDPLMYSGVKKRAGMRQKMRPQQHLRKLLRGRGGRRLHRGPFQRLIKRGKREVQLSSEEEPLTYNYDYGSLENFNFNTSNHWDNWNVTDNSAPLKMNISYHLYQLI